MSDYEAVGRAVERIYAAGASWMRLTTDASGTMWGVRMVRGEVGENEAYTAYTYHSPGEALIALADLVDPSWETRLRERCEVLGLVVGSYQFGEELIWVIYAEGDGHEESRAYHADRETACRAALAALDVLYPQEAS